MVQRSVLAFDSEALIVSDNPNGGPAIGSAIINNSDTPDGTVFTYQGGFGAAVVTIDDTNAPPDDDVFNDDDTGNHTVINGAGLVADGQSVESESLIQIRALDGAGNPVGPTIDLYVFSQGGVTQDVWGFATDVTLTPGVEYVKVAGSNNGDSLYADFVCFANGTLIRTPDGPVPVEALRPGDKVWTTDDPAAVVQWVGSKTVHASGPSAPVVFEAGAIGNAAPLIVSQQHRILLQSAAASVMFGAAEVLAPAHSLLALDGVRLIEGATVTYHHIMFDGHKIVEGNGVLSESFYPGAAALNALEQSARDEIVRLFPELATQDAPGRTAAPALRPFEAAALAAAMG